MAAMETITARCRRAGRRPFGTTVEWRDGIGVVKVR